MKKYRVLSLLLCIILMVQLIAVPASAQTTAPAEEETLPPVSHPQTTVTDTFTGTDASVQAGCRTVEAKVPLHGSNRILQTAQSALLYEVNTGTMMYSYNPDTQLYPSSFVKVMTVLIAMEQGDPEEMVTVSETALEGFSKSNVNIKLLPGEQMTLIQLLNGIIVGNGNDACLVVAEHIAGSQEAFVQMMNDRAQQIGCTSTVYTNCHGLHDERQVTTARDMLKLYIEALKNEGVAEILGNASYAVPATNMSDRRDWHSNNYFLGEYFNANYHDDRVKTGRSGTTTDNLYNLVASAQTGNMEYIAIVMGTERKLHKNGYTVLRFGDFDECTELLAMGMNGHVINQILFEDQIVDQYNVLNAANSVTVTPARPVSSVLPSGTKIDNLSWKTQMATSGLSAPVKAGQKLAVLQVWYGNVCIAQSDLLAYNDTAVSIPEQEQQGVFNTAGLVQALAVLGIIFAVILLLFGIMFVIRMTRGAMLRNRSKRRRQGRRRSR